MTNETALPVHLVLEPIYDETVINPTDERRFPAWFTPNDSVEIELTNCPDGRVQMTLYAEQDGIFHPDEEQKIKLPETLEQNILRQIEPEVNARPDDKFPMQVHIQNRMQQPMTLWIEPYCTEIKLTADQEIKFRAVLFPRIRSNDPKEKDLEMVLCHRQDELWLTLWLYDLEDEMMFMELSPTAIDARDNFENKCDP